VPLPVITDEEEVYGVDYTHGTRKQVPRSRQGPKIGRYELVMQKEKRLMTKSTANTMT